MSVAGESMVGLMQRLEVYYVSYIHISCTHSHTSSSVTCVMEQKPEGIKCGAHRSGAAAKRRMACT